ncbi:tyrosine-protein kinase receptor [Conger conger]|uniref:tyrosine-protein kinase receptor n=1 Tax=Conger conger TaxID=82655 RepID=UPI002A5AA372|nr:tyrosine-protein kinase receptor [Conger conger]
MGLAFDSRTSKLSSRAVVLRGLPNLAAACDFESPCSWTLSNHSAGGDWHVTSPEQLRASMETVWPATDHSIGGTDGHFLSLMATAGKDSGSCEVSLSSPVLSNSGPLCHLQLARFQPEYGQGNLSVHIRLLESASVISSPVLSHLDQDVAREQWEVLEAQIGQFEEPFQVSLLYSFCGEDGRVTLAIDSLELNNCNMDSMPLGSHCSFEYGLCGWSVSGHPSPWTLVSGKDLASTEEILGSTLQKTEGHFLLLRVRSTETGGVALAQSPPLPATVGSGDCQVQFFLYMFGEFNGTVSLSIEENGTTAAPLVWERSGSLKDSWLDVTLLPDFLNSFHLTLSALWGSNSNADIAVDQIALSTSCYDTDQDPVFLRHRFFHDMDDSDDLDFFSPLQDPSVSEVSLLTWWFTSCGASGPRGPTQAQCDNAYRNTNVSVTVGKDGPFKGVQLWRVPATNHYMISAYGAAGGKGAKNHNKRSHGVFISAIFPLEKGDILYILVGHQGEDACPGRNAVTQQICLGESSVIEDGLRTAEWAGGGGGGGGATYIYRLEDGVMVPLLIAAGGGGKAYLEDPESSQDHIPLELYENDTDAAGTNGKTVMAGGGGGWSDRSSTPWAGKSLLEGADGGSSCPQAQSRLGWSTYGGFGGGGGACTAGGGGGGYRGGDTADTDDLTADGQAGISFVHPMGEIFLQPLAAMESHGEAEIKVQLNCTHCQSQSCKRDEDTKLILCLCHDGKELAGDNVTCTDPRGPAPDGQLSLPLILAVVATTLVMGVVLTCVSLMLIYYRKKNQLHAARVRLQSPEYKLSKIRTSTIMTDYNPNYCFAGKVASMSELKDIPRRNITLLRALGHGAFGEVYEGQVLGITEENSALQVAVKTLPEICSEQDEMDFLMEALIMSKFSHQNIVRCIGVSLQILPRFILLELMTGGDLKSFLRQNRPRVGQASSLSMLDLLQMAQNIALGCRYLEENHFIHRDIAARNCLLTCPGPGRVAKIGDFGMARDIYRASYYRKGGRAMLPVKWMPPEAFLEGIFTCKTDTWSFGVLLWEIFSLGYMPYPCKTNQEVLEFVTSGGRMDPPKSCPGPVYRIMTQCWQHCPEHRPNFSTILERINYCTQDPDVITTPLPVECGPVLEEEGFTVTRPEGSDNLLSLSPETPPQPASPAAVPKVHRPHLQPPQDPAVHREGPETAWAEAAPPQGLCPGPWLSQDPPACPAAPPASCSQKLKNKTKNLWNPTYGSWMLESLGRAKKPLSQTQSMPLSTASSASTVPEHEGFGSDGNSSSPPLNSLACPGVPSSLLPCGPQGPASLLSPKAPPEVSGGSNAGADLAKLHSFPCGNVNYAYDEHSYEAESLPLVAKAPKSSTSASSVPSTSGAGLGNRATGFSKPLVKRHASYGHEDVKRHCRLEKQCRDRDSGFSLSEDLSVTPI